MVGIALPFRSGFVRLGWVIDDSEQVRGIDGNVRNVRQADTNHFRLVVTSFALAPFVQRHGHQVINSLKKACCKPFLRRYFAQENAQLRAVVVFELVNELAEGKVVLVITERPASLELALVPKLLLYFIAQAHRHFGAGQSGYAVGAKQVFFFL